MLMKKKFWIISSSCILIVLLAVTLFAGNYLVNYVLVVDEQGRLGSLGGDEVYNGIQDTQAKSNMMPGSHQSKHKNGPSRVKTD